MRQMLKSLDSFVFGGNETLIPFRHFSLMLILFAGLIPLSYAVYTGHIWEDFFITFKFSKNLAEGRGIVYEDGIRIHGFTSPLGMLLPSLGYFLTGNSSYISAIWFYRLVFCIPAFVLSAVFLVRTMTLCGACTKVHIFFASLLFLLETKSVIYSVNGMETSLMLLFILMSFYYINKDLHSNWIVSGLSWAGIMWTRPDGFIFIGLIVIAWGIFNRDRIDRKLLFSLLKAAAVCTIAYLPWFVFAWWYYGSPVPNTIRAKSALMAHYTAWQYVSYAVMKLPYGIIWVFAPVYVQFFGWPQQVIWFSAVLGAASFLLWLLPSADRISRSASLVFFALCFYLSIMFFPFPWYYPSLAIFGIVAITMLPSSLASALKFKISPAAQSSILGFVAVMCLCIFLATSYEMKIQQKVIEEGHRVKIGRWLKENMKPDERLYLECLGYVGYFSEARVYDFSGLVTPRVIKAIREKDLGFATVVPEIQPDWILARPLDCIELERIPYFNENYRLVRSFEVYDELEKFKVLPGEGYLLYDAAFFIFKKK